MDLFYQWCNVSVNRPTAKSSLAEREEFALQSDQHKVNKINWTKHTFVIKITLSAQLCMQTTASVSTDQMLPDNWDIKLFWDTVMNGGSSFVCFHICECCWCCWCCGRIQYICSIMMGEQHVFSTQNCVTDYYITVVPVESRLLLLKEIRVFGKLQNRISSKMFGWFFLFVNFSLMFRWYFLRLKVTQFQMFQDALTAKCFPT